MNKILVIGQALPDEEKRMPYSTTIFKDWILNLGISLDKAEDFFDYDAISDRHPGYEGAYSTVPSYEQMMGYFNRSLKAKISKYEKIIVLGHPAKTFLLSENALLGKKVLYLIHPAMRNYQKYLEFKYEILDKIKQFLILKLE